MKPLKDDCFAFGDRLMPMAEALALLSGRLTPVAGEEEVGLKTALGRITAAELRSSVQVPAHDNSAVDGYALRHADLAEEGPTRLKIDGRASAGHPMPGPLKPGCAARIFTGAVMPEGADSVVMQEDVGGDGEHVIVPTGLAAGRNRRRRGEDTRIGDKVLAQGHRLRPQDIGFIASVGIDRLQVFRRLRVAVLSSGDELAEPGQNLTSGGVHDSNRYIVQALLAGLDCQVDDLGILPDRFEAVHDGLRQAARSHDLLITSGGMSTGEEDHIKAAVEALGSLYFWRLAIKPGRPIALGQVAGVPFIGLPGNPVAAMICFLRFARPIILQLSGVDPAGLQPTYFTVPAGFAMEKKPDRREWVRSRLERGPDGRLRAMRFPAQGSGILRSMVESDGLVEIPEPVTKIALGDPVEFLPFSEVMK